MQPVKGRHATLLRELGVLFSAPPHKRLDYAELGNLLGASEEAVKTWARRGIPPWAQLKLLELAELRGEVTWQEAKRLLQGVKTRPGSAQGASRVAERTTTPSGGSHRGGVGSAAVRDVERGKTMEGALVLARRIAETVKNTILRHEMGYSATSRSVLADSLEVFAQDLDTRCGETVAADIWKVVAWLRKPEGK